MRKIRIFGESFMKRINFLWNIYIEIRQVATYRLVATQKKNWNLNRFTQKNLNKLNLKNNICKDF